MRCPTVTRLSKFVPKHSPSTAEDVDALTAFIATYRGILCLTGAGISTESGIPDYRSEDVGLYATSNHKPTQFQDFVKYPSYRKAYWARSFIGWPRNSALQPNAAHLELKRWQDDGTIGHIVTQNVDGLHTKAGSAPLTELHGTNWTVKCIKCQNHREHRNDFQKRLAASNPEFTAAVNERLGVGKEVVRPDGDVDLPRELVKSFVVPSCPCGDGGIMMTDVVFFGDNVPKERVDAVKSEVAKASALLVVGSSLYVFSGYRFILQAKELGKRIAVVNIGPTRADHLVDLKVEARASDVLAKINCSLYS